MTHKQPKVIIEEEVINKVDTLSIAKADTAVAGLGRSLRKIENRRSQKIDQLASSEEDLLRANNKLMQQLLKIMRYVEKQEIEQVKEKTHSTVLLAGETINRTRVITIFFIVIGLIFSILILTDITRSRKYRQQLEDAKAEAEYHSLSKQRFLSNMSHEIRTPLQSIIGYAEQQMNSGKGPNENIQAIYKSSEHLLQVVNEVLDYSRITSGKFSLESDVFSIKKVASEVISALELLSAKKSLSLQINLTELESIEYVTGDAFRLKQVLFNLLGNAIKFTEEGYIKLNIRAKRNGDRVILSIAVEDTGIGMTAEEMKHIFNQFEQTGPAGKRVSGTGLGLSIVKELVEGQEGSISVQSEPGKGSRFEITIPYLHADHTVAGTNEKRVDKSFLQVKVWLVDDDPLILRLSSMILDRQNIPHKCFNTAEELLNEKWDPEVKVVFTDIRLPGIGGAQLCWMLRKKIPPDTKIIALTAQVMPEEKEAILKNGFNGLLVKPFREGDLLDALNEKRQAYPSPEIFDFTMLEKMAGDKKQVTIILQQCHRDTGDDLRELSEAVQNADREKTSLLIHRLAGRMGQIGAKKLATQLRKREAAIRRESDFDGFKDEMEDLLYEVQLFLERLSNFIRTESLVLV